MIPTRPREGDQRNTRPAIPAICLVVSVGCAPTLDPTWTLTADPPILDLGAVAMGELASGEVLLSHDGEGRVTITDLTLSAPDRWSAALLDPTLDPAQQEPLVVGLVAKGKGPLDDALIVTTADGLQLKVALRAEVGGSAQPDDTGEPDDSDDTDLPPETVDGPEAFSWDRDRVQQFAFTIDEAGINSLRTAPSEWVSGSLEYAGFTWDQVAFRLKGSSSFQAIDQKPAWKIKFGEYVEGGNFYGLERLTLNNEVWDATMMAENMAYWTWREQGNPAPLTSYASITLNGRLLGVYAILESMDDDFMDRMWPGSNGGLYEMTRNCDFTGDCSCFDLQETGPDFDPQGIKRGCEAVAEGTVEALAEAFDWDSLLTYLAVELSLNHPDSYSFNLNNFFVYHDPIGDRLYLSPWGADSTWTYFYPPSTPTTAGCDHSYGDVLDWSAAGWLMRFCRSDSTCRAELKARVTEIADWMEAADVVGQMEATRDLLDPYAGLETHVNWTVENRADWVACTLAWTKARPATLRAWAAQP